MLKGWLRGEVSTSTLLGVLDSKVTAAKNAELNLVALKLSETQIRKMLPGTRDFIVQITVNRELTATCKACSQGMSTAIKDEYCWFYCPQCHRISFTPLMNIQRDAGLARKDGRTLKYEMYFMPELPPTLKAPFQTLYPVTTDDLSELVQISERGFLFKEYNLSIDFPSVHWQLVAEAYGKNPYKEFFVVARQAQWIDTTGAGYSPTLMVTFFPIPKGIPLNQLPGIAHQRGLPQFSIDSTFSSEGSELHLDIPALGHYGHLDSQSFKGMPYSVYFVFLVKATTGVVISLEIVDSVLEQAKPEFYQIMRSIRFIK